MKNDDWVVHLHPSQRGAFFRKAEIIPNEPGRVMPPREALRRILELHRFPTETKIIY